MMHDDVMLMQKRKTNNFLIGQNPGALQLLIRDIHSGECGHHSCARTLAGKVFRSGFYWPQALQDAMDIIQACEACQFHAKQIHQPALGLQTIPLSWPFAV